MTRLRTEALVTPQWLHDHLDAPDLRVIDASYFMPASGRDARQDYEAAHIPGAIFFDINAVADTSQPKPHSLPAPEVFSSACRGLGIGDGQRLVVYDRNGGAMAAARVWWMFRLFGQSEVSVLDGGIGAWQAEGRPTDDLPRLHGRRHFTARLDNTLMRTASQVREAVESGRAQVVDARSSGRFTATAPEPWPVARVGHIPGSINLPYTDLVVASEHGRLADREILTQAFAKAGVDLGKPVIATCGSGVSACVIALAAAQLGHETVAVYDGSWFEWSGLADYPTAP
ncbi:3-mercaptopyruvate sulfurtransferase [Rhodospirillum rubrum]|uniref:3-mercaptopyruvate sulfurtransferase n=1 Tax=Rhodospirillum rubrum TaxID=1085 RepID=UPI001905E1E6|nr:3-mercaptopyruvate sulfurtransferase [Rhodospirillum rubrum]MBK1665166.1 3-mercaptopyruvate sulfurtransferase [Rhodospirillum rubrum]MBK1676791.1 3-mercaptopyruvate sulfurtransferase [Rhodospirillum rubrum]